MILRLATIRLIFEVFGKVKSFDLSRDWKSCRMGMFHTKVATDSLEWKYSMEMTKNSDILNFTPFRAIFNGNSVFGSKVWHLRVSQGLVQTFVHLKYITIFTFKISFKLNISSGFNSKLSIWISAYNIINWMSCDLAILMQMQSVDKL